MIRKLFSYLQPSFEGDNGKASAPKLSALWFIILVTILHLWWLHKAMRTGDFILLPEILYTDCATIITLLGLKVWERVKTNKNNNDQRSDISDKL